MGEAFDIVVTGVGGQGVITMGRIAGMAAHLQGMGSSVLDFPGMAQKGGGVMSYVRLNRMPGKEQSSRVPPGQADLLLAGDMVTALDTETIGCIGTDVTRAIVNSHVSPTGANVLNPQSMIDSARLRKQLGEVVGAVGAEFVDASVISEKLTGDAITANIFLLGYACQSGALLISREAVSQAIRLNGTAVESNLRCFGYGRLAAHDADLVREISGELTCNETSDQDSTLDELIELREAHLGEYQNSAYGVRFRALVDTAREAETKVEGATGEFGRAVAKGFFQLMAYKDEYEVARLFSDKKFHRALQSQFSGNIKITHHLAPSLLSRRDKETGHLRKRAFGPWLHPMLSVLARFKFLRGTPFDPFGYTDERRQERRRVADYEERIRSISASLSSTTLEAATEIAGLALTIRGFGHVKEHNARLAEDRLRELLK